MKLYYTPGTCALAPHIVALEAGIPLELVKVDLKTKTVTNEGDFWAINPKGYVPALELDDAERLTEGPRDHAIPRGPEARQPSRARERHICACATPGNAQLHYRRRFTRPTRRFSAPTCCRRSATIGSPT